MNAPGFCAGVALRLRRAISFCLIAAAIWAGNSALGAEATPGKGWRPSTAGDEVFTNLVVLKIRIDITPAGMDALRRTELNDWNHSVKRPEVKCTVREGGMVYSNVAVHLKGAAGSSQPIDGDPAMTLHFDRFVEGQTFHGLKKISLNNSVQDPSFLSEKICRELFDQAGVPVPRAGFAMLTLNGHGVGPRVLLEGYNRQFLKRYFADTSGNLYDGGFLKEITDRLDTNSGDHPEDQSDLKRLLAAANKPASERFAALEKVLDIDRFLKFVAMDIIQCNWDGYAMNKNNWRLYHDMPRDKMIFMPHGLDQMFGYARANAQYPIQQPWNGLVVRQFMATSEGRKRYLETVAALTTNVFDAAKITNRVDEFRRAFRPAIAELSPQLASSVDAAARNLMARIAARGAFLRRQTGNLGTPVKFSADGTTKLAGWKPKIDTTGGGVPVFSESTDPDGAKLLQIGATGAISASFRTQLLLAPGHYRFEGQVKLEKLVPLADEQRGGGVCLRISRGTMPKRLTGTTDWRSFAYEFVVEEVPAEVELVCESRAQSGKASFNASTLKLVKE